MYKIEFRVKGFGSFPKDMLRYSDCEARSSDDQASIEADPNDWTGPREIELVRTASNITAAKFLAPKRWESFGWKVIREGKPFHVAKPVSDGEFKAAKARRGGQAAKPRGRAAHKIELVYVKEGGPVDWTCPGCGYRNQQTNTGRGLYFCLRCGTDTELKIS